MNQKEDTAAIETRMVRISDFVNARSAEIAAFSKTLREKMQNLNKIPFQLLPRHLRRRAMSHNKYRIPTRIRNKIKESDLLLKQPSKCRKHLRKSRLLLSSYARRSRRSKWLESHIWHAKRMKMKDYFGYKISDFCYDKTERATYRYIKNDATLYDMSYYGVFELSASTKQEIIDYLAPYCKQGLKDLSKSKLTAAGLKATKISIYAAKTLDMLIGRFECFWMPAIENVLNSEEKLWMISHPSCKEPLLKLAEENQAISKVKSKYFEDVFGMYHLIGPKSCAKVARVLDQLGFNDIESKDEYSKLLELFEFIHDPAIYPANFLHYLSFEANVKQKLVAEPMKGRISQYGGLYREKSMQDLNDLLLLVEDFKKKKPQKKSDLEIWETSDTPAEDIYSQRFKVTVRGRFTHKKSKIKKEMQSKTPVSKGRKNNQEIEIEEEKPSGAKTTNKDVEMEIETEDKEQRLKALDKNEEIKKNGLDKTHDEMITQNEGVEEEKGATDANKELRADKQSRPTVSKRFRMIIIQDNGDQNTFGAGLKIIASPEIGLTFWKYAVLSGCKVLGMYEYNAVLNESRQAIFPNDFPNSIGYQIYAQERQVNAQKEYFKKPVAKRINYIKIASPFAFNPGWNELTKPLVKVFIRASNGCVPEDQAAIFIPNKEDNFIFTTQRGADNLLEEPIHSKQPQQQQKNEIPLKDTPPEEYFEGLKQSIPTRKIIGYITTGYHSYRFGFGCGKGYASRDLLQQLQPTNALSQDDFDKNGSFTNIYQGLFRNASSRFYHSCRIYVFSKDEI